MATTTEPTTTAPHPRRRHRWLRWLGLILLALLLIILLAAGWLLGTGSGLRFALGQASSFTKGALTVGSAQGRLIGPLDLRKVRYNNGKGTDVTLASVHLNLRFWPLLAKRVHITALDAEGIVARLPPSDPNAPKSTSSFSLKPPVGIIIDQAHVGSVQVIQAGKPLFASNSLDLAASWTDSGIAIRQLDLKAPDGHAQVSGKLAVGTGYSGNGKADFAWKVGSNQFAGSLDAHSDGDRANLLLTLTQPTAVHLQLTLQQSGNYDWTGTLDVPRFDPKPLLGSSSLTALGLALKGSGDEGGGIVNGEVDLNKYALLLQPLKARFSDDMKTLKLEQLALGSPQIPGTVNANGVVNLGATPISGDMNIAWKGLQLPADLVGQKLASQGQLKASGSAKKFHADGDVDIGPPGNLAKLALNLDGTQQQIVLHTLALKQPKGGLDASGTVTLKPVVGWNLEATAKRLDPGQLVAGWGGALNFGLATEGSLPKAGPEVTLDLRKLNGTLRQRAISGGGKLHVSSNEVVDGKLRLASGNSTVAIDARPGPSNDVDLKLAIASLGDWLPDASGRLNGQFKIKGRQPKLSVNGTLNGQGIVYGKQKIKSLRLIVGVPDISHPAGKLDLQTRNLNLSGLLFQGIDLLAEGSQGDHKLTVDAVGKQLSANLVLTGALKGQRWNGTVSTLKLEPGGLPGFALQKPANLTYDNGAASLSELCLTAGDPLLCFAADQDKAGNLKATYRLRSLPLALVLNAAGLNDMPVRVDGQLQGDGDIARSAKGALTGTASITSAKGTVIYTDQPNPPLLSYDALALKAQLQPDSQHVNLHIGLNDGGHVDGDVGISGKQQALSGQVNMHLGNLAFVELLTSQVAKVKGIVDANFRLGGTVAQPAVTGQAGVKSFAAEVPAAGLKLSQGDIALSTTDAKTFDIKGSVKSGKGTMSIAGSAGLGANALTTITLKGNQFTAADIPAARVVISPDLVIKKNADGLNIGGSVTMDSVDANLEKLPGAGATQASPDVVIVDQKQQAKQAGQLPITADVTVNLGKKTHLVGMGLDGNLTGQLVVHERPGRPPIGQGQIDVAGTYKAYGQDLTIKRGQLLFASTPVANPGLNIRAARSLNPNATIDTGQEVGLYITGTAMNPVLTVFSNPPMEQSDALSYLVTGKPLSDVSSGQGSAVNSAAQALGSAGGDLLAKRIGSKLGVDDIGVSSSDALGGNSAFTVGKYLSPRLYLSYGIGLFEPGQVITLRYLISQRWNFEAENATQFSRAGFNYKLEK